MTEESTPTERPAPILMFTQMGDLPSLYAALAEAQGMYESAKKTSTNPHFKSRFAPLEEVISATKEAHAKCGISVIQPVVSDEFGNMYLMTIVSHKAGGCIESTMPVGTVEDVQDLGSKLTYLRRYSRSAVLGIASEEDDDGNASAQPQKRNQPAPAPAQRAPVGGLSESARTAVTLAGKAKGLSSDEFKAACKAQTGKDWPNLLPADADKFLEYLQRAE